MESESASSVRAPLAFAAVLLAAWSLRVVALLPHERLMAPLPRGLVDVAARLVVFGVLPLLWWRLVDPLPAWAVLRPVRGVAPGVAAVLGLVYVAAVRLSVVLQGGPWAAVPAFAGAADVAAAAAQVAAMAVLEEVVFRGYLLGRLRPRLGLATANVVQAVAFTLVHWPGWLMVGGVGVEDLAMLSAPTLLFGLIAGGLVRLQGGLTAAMATHAAVNLLGGGGF